MDINGTFSTITAKRARENLGIDLPRLISTVASVAALRALPVTNMVDGSLAQTAVYSTDNDGGGATYVWAASSTAADDNGLTIKPTAVSGAGRWKLQLLNGGDLPAAAFGVKGDYDFSAKAGTDNTAAMQAVINAAGSVAEQGNGLRILLPKGGILTGSLNVFSQVAMVGRGQHATCFVLKGSETKACFVLKMTGPSDFVQAGGAAAQMSFRDFRITGQLGWDNGSRTAHGFDVQAGTPNYWVEISDVWLYNLGGAGIYSANYGGFVEVTRSNFLANNYGIDVNSVYDWRFISCDWGTNRAANVRVSGAGQMNFLNPNIYTSGGYGFVSYFSDVKIVGGDISFNKLGGLHITADSAGLGRRVNLVGTTNMGLNGFGTPGTNSDIEVYGTGPALAISQCRFRNKPRSQDAGSNIKHNIWIEGGQFPEVTIMDAMFEMGSIDAADVTNARSKLRALSLVPYGTYTPVVTGGTTLTLGAVAGAYQLTGRRANVEIVIPITQASTDAYFMTVTLPPGVTPRRDGTVTAYNKSAGKVISGELVASQNIIYLRGQDASFPGANNITLTINASFEMV